MTTPATAVRRRELGEFLRAHRARLTPAMLGLAAGARRRTPGLRREEVAQLCGMSATWYTWIEQGREVSVSPAALARLAETLRLARAERAYLFDLAGKRDPALPVAPAPAAVPPALVATVTALAEPAYLLDRCWTARAWNKAAARLFAGWLDGDGGDRNLLRYIFLVPGARHLICDWEARARRVIAEFRSDYSAHLDDPEMRALIEALRRGSAFFARAWDAHAVVAREGGLRTFNHPREGFLRYEQVTLTPASQPGLKLVVLVKVAGEAKEERVRRRAAA
ncbi:MAG TPA: helix-turn-helix transcriptional regulator [Alphaproteobacteria bacterium]|nr:helix-turn-helix transcriptional regulator [Alphaproteobacteria bacterium]